MVSRSRCCCGLCMFSMIRIDESCSITGPISGPITTITGRFPRFTFSLSLLYLSSLSPLSRSLPSSLHLSPSLSLPLSPSDSPSSSLPLSLSLALTRSHSLSFAHSRTWRTLGTHFAALRSTVAKNSMPCRSLSVRGDQVLADCAAVCSRAVTHVHDLDACAHIVR